MLSGGGNDDFASQSLKHGQVTVGDADMKTVAGFGVSESRAVGVDDRADLREGLDGLVPIGLGEVRHADIVIGLVGPNRFGVVAGYLPQRGEGRPVLMQIEMSGTGQVEAFEVHLLLAFGHLPLAAAGDLLDIPKRRDGSRVISLFEKVLPQREIGLEADGALGVLFDDRFEHLDAAVLFAGIKEVLGPA